MIPNRKHFDVAFVLGERAVQNALASDFPDSIKELVRGAQKDVEIVKKLAEIKMMK